MAFSRVSTTGAVVDEAAFPFPRTSGATFTAGQVVAWNRASQVIAAATSSTDSQSANCYIGTVKQTTTAADLVLTEVQVVPFQNGQVFLVDTNANTAASQRGARCRLTNSNTLDNQADRTTASDVFEIIKEVGAAADRKALVRIVGCTGQVNA